MRSRRPLPAAWSDKFINTPPELGMQDDDVSRYYRSITRYEALRIVADAAHLPLLIFFALFFAAGVYVGRWSVVLETRQRRKHLAEAVRGQDRRRGRTRRHVDA